MYEPDRFLKAQETTYDTALKEIRAGRKRSHWMWFIFPQLRGLGRSSMAWEYGIDGIGEAKAYMEDDILRSRLIEISEALLELETDDAYSVMGHPDDMKLRSSMTLFSIAAPQEEVFAKVLTKYFDGEPDDRTLKLLKNA